MPSRRRPTATSTEAAPRVTAEDDPQVDHDETSSEALSGAWNPDATPPVAGYEAVDDGPPPLVGAGVPAVVAVVVTRNPGPWLEATLDAIAAQEYANLATLVVDAGSIVDPTDRIAASLPGAFVKRVASASYAHAANAALGAVEGAAFLLFLHDDSELQTGAVQAMVEQAFRANAGIVGAKLVDWDDPTRLRSLGASIDKFGFAWPVVEPGELDQAQHDAAREVFVVSTAAMLVRADLFDDIGGFSIDIDGSAEDLDLCWRARLAGGRAAVMPAAVVRHRERSELGDPTGRGPHVALRHQARVVLACYSPAHLFRVIPQAVLLAVLDTLWSAVRGRFRQAATTAGSVLWNIGHLPTTLAVRRVVKRTRRTPDAEIRRLQVGGSARVTAFVRGRRAATPRSLHSALAVAARDKAVSPLDDTGIWGVTAAVIVGVALLVGSRGLIAGGVPAIREFTDLGRPADLLREWWSGWRSPGLGADAAAPTILGVVGAAEFLFVGGRGLLRTSLFLAPMGLGAFACWRMLRGAASPPARVAALAAYVVVPVAQNAMAAGRWQALVVYAAAPSVFGRLARAGGWAPFDRVELAPGSTQRQAVGLALVLGAAAMVAPVVVVVAAVMCAMCCLVMVLTGTPGHPRRAVGVLGGAFALAAVLHLPWTLHVLSDPDRWASLVRAQASRSPGSTVTAAMRFETGPHGGYMTLGLVVAAAASLLIARSHRLRWAIVGTAFTLTSWAVVVGGRRWSPAVVVPSTELLLVPGALGLALCIAMGVDGFRSDVVRAGFGIRQVVSALGVVAALVATVPMVATVAGGRWSMPEGDLSSSLRSLRTIAGRHRTLWLGDPDALPVRGWPLRSGVSMALTEGTRPTLASIDPGPGGRGEDAIRDKLESARRNATARLGSELGRFGVRFVIVVERLAPLPFGRESFPTDRLLTRVLADQLDLARIEVAPGVTVYENLATRPVRFSLPAAQVPIAEAPAIEATDVETAIDVVPALADLALPTGATGSLGANRSLIVASNRDPGWTLSAGGATFRPRSFSSWAMSFDPVPAGPVRLQYDSSPGTTLAHVAQLLAFLSLPWLRRRRVSELRLRTTRPRGTARGDEP